MKLTVIGSATIVFAMENGTTVQIVSGDPEHFECFENASYNATVLAVEVSRGIGNPLRIPAVLGGGDKRGAIKLETMQQLGEIMYWASNPSRWIDEQVKRGPTDAT